MDEETIRQIVIDALESVIDDCERYRDDPNGLEIVSQETVNKCKSALRLLEEK